MTGTFYVRVMANFDKMTDDGRKLFLGYDQDRMIRHYDLRYDGQYLYFWCLCRLFRIVRESGFVEELPERIPLEVYRKSSAKELAFPEKEWRKAGNELAMTLYDVLCYGRDDAAATGEYINLNSLVTMISAAGNPGEGMFTRYDRRFEEQSDLLEKALDRLGGWKEGKGDIARELPLFDFMNVRFQFWHADEDFPPSTSAFVDTGILQFMHFETVWYLMNFFMRRIGEEMREC